MYLFWQVGQKQSEGDQWAEVLENSRLLGIFTEKESENLELSGKFSNKMDFLDCEILPSIL